MQLSNGVSIRTGNLPNCFLDLMGAFLGGLGFGSGDCGTVVVLRGRCNGSFHACLGVDCWP